MAVRDSDTSLWLHNKLGTSNDSWTGDSICSQLNAEVLRNIKECFPDLQTQVKLKLLLAFFHISKKNISEWKIELEEILEVAQVDGDRWVSVLGEVMRTFPSSGTLTEAFENLENKKIFDDLLEEFKTLSSARQPEVPMLPLEDFYLNKPAFMNAIGHLPAPKKHFLKKHRTRAEVLRQELLQKCTDLTNSIKKNVAPTVPVRSRGMPRKMTDTTPLKGLPSRLVTNGFKSQQSSGTGITSTSNSRPTQSSRLLTGRKDCAIKLLDIAEQPVAPAQSKKRKRMQEQEELANKRALDESMYINNDYPQRFKNSTNTSSDMLSTPIMAIPSVIVPSGTVSNTTNSSVPATNSTFSVIQSTSSVCQFPTSSTSVPTITPASSASPVTSTIIRKIVNRSPSPERPPTPTIKEDIRTPSPLLPPPTPTPVIMNHSSLSSVICEPTNSRMLSSPSDITGVISRVSPISCAPPPTPAPAVSPTSLSMLASSPPPLAPTPTYDTSLNSSPSDIEYNQSYASSPSSCSPQNQVLTPLTPVNPASSNYSNHLIHNNNTTTTATTTNNNNNSNFQGQTYAVLQTVPPPATPQTRDFSSNCRLTDDNIFSSVNMKPERTVLLNTSHGNYQKEYLLVAQEMFSTANKVTRPEKALILGFMAGSRENPCPHLGNIVTIKLSENQENVVQSDGSMLVVKVETHFQMNYSTGGWKRIKKYKELDHRGIPRYTTITQM